MVVTLKKMINRPYYLDQLLTFLDRPVIKILTGIRRSGKSTLLQLLRNALIEKGIKDDCILLVNLESFLHMDLTTDRALYQKVQEFAQGKPKIYVLLDEIQEVDHWEKAVNAIQVDFEVDLYLTGSNSNLLSSELATFLAGRYVEIPVYPLNFLESIDFASKRGAEHLPLRDAFFRFLYLGGFPIVHGYDYPKEAAWKLIADIYASALLRDTVQRHKIRDVELLERVVKFVFDNVGSLFSAKRVADFFKSQQRRIDLNTVYTYLNALESAFLIYRVPRFDVKGRELLKTNEKYFIGDHAMSYALFGQRDRLISGLLENIVFLDLKSKGFKVYTGKVGDKEVDFVAERGADRIYIQVAYKVDVPSTLEREYASLLEIKDNYPKFLLTLDGDFRDNFQGIEALPVYEFLSRP